MREIDDHVFAKIRATRLETDPFPHIYVRDIFPTEFYRRLIAELPPNEAYEAYAPPYAARTSLNIEPKRMMPLGQFWQSFEAWINSQHFLDSMVARFADVLPSMGRFRSEQLAANSVGDFVRIGCRTQLARDYGNFALGPHTDAPQKFITALFYLPSDGRFASFGTSLYRPKTAGFKAWVSEHYPHDQFELIKTFPNVPNAAMIFAKTDDSFHGVEPGTYSDDGRNILQWAPQIGRSRKTWGDLRLHRSVFGSS